MAEALETKTPVRNHDGKLLCELVYDEGRWNVLIKHKNCVTHIELSVNGSVNLTDYMIAKTQ